MTTFDGRQPWKDNDLCCKRFFDETQAYSMMTLDRKQTSTGDYFSWKTTFDNQDSWFVNSGHFVLQNNSFIT